MPHLTITLLGPPQIAIDGVPIKLPTLRAIPILAYLAITGVSQTRETIANFLWSDEILPRALAALRTTLWRLKEPGLDDWIILERNKISLNYQKSIQVDVLDFKAKVNKCTTHGHPPSQICLYCIPALTEAVELYHGDFMSGFNLSKAQSFDDWRLQESEELNGIYLDALERLVKGHRAFGDFTLAIQYARIWSRHDRYNETAQHDLLQLYSITGQRAPAIHQYKRYKDFLSRELGISPSEELSNLHKQILAGRVSPLATQKVKTPIFLIADIDKAALLWARPGVKKDDILLKYHNIIKDTSRRFGGHILQVSEDNITVLFENGNPLHCAVTLHLKISKTDWGIADPPNIRMVLYSTATDHNNPYNFALIARAASTLLSISWGGQIVFTEQLLNLLDLPPGSQIKDLGFHTLKDTDGPVHVFELLHPHLPASEHPPLHSVSLLSTNLPTLTPSFIGREPELNELTRLIDSPECRIISLVGPGGIGKTRLAVQFATQIAERFPDGIFFISLASIEDPDLIPIILADTLKFSFYGPRDHTEQLADYLHRMKALLVFDNFEHLRLEGSNFLAFLLSMTHHLKILVTTRERLNMLAETSLEVQGFPVPPAVTIEDFENYSSIKLFLKNAQRISPRFNLEFNAPAIIQICRHLNGLPLGIILASSWTRVYSCQQIAEQIRTNIDFLDSSASDLAPRHRSLRGVFDQSWRLLSEEERLILRQLSIFRSAFTAPIAEEICAASPRILATLLDKSLLNRQDDRYEMLDTFHQYAYGKLEASPEEFIATRMRFCEYYANYCEQKNLELNSTIQRQALDEVISEIENIRIAWNWMIDMGQWDRIMRVKDLILTFHIILGNFILGREFFRLALIKLDNLNDPALGQIHASMLLYEAWMRIKIGYTNEAIPVLLKCLETFRLYHSRWDIVLTLMFLADAHCITGNHQQGKIFIENALQLILASSLPNLNRIIAINANCQSILGTIFIELGDFEQAQYNLQASLATHRKIGTHYGSIRSLLGLGKLAYLKGEFLHARDLYLQALETATNIYDQRGMALIHNNLGAIYECLTDINETYHHTLSALKLCQETGDRRTTALILNNLAYHQLRYLHQPAEAIRTYQESIEVFSSIGDLRGIFYTSYDIIKVYLQVGLVDEATAYCFQVLNTALTLDSTSLILHSLHAFVTLYSSTNQLERALGLCNLIEKHPQIEADTQKKVIVSRSVLETMLEPDMIGAARLWAESANLQNVIDQILASINSQRI